MGKRLPKEVEIHLRKAKESVTCAVDSYNRCGATFRSGNFIVLMCIGWTSLFHAIYFKRKEKPFYKEKENPKRYQKIDGDYKAWELSTCLENYFQGQSNGIKTNLQFLVGLRNKIEHRSMPELDNFIFGECQACLFNFEDILLKEFGTKHGLTDCLSLAIQFSRLRDTNQSEAISRLRTSLQPNIKNYIDTFRSSLTPQMSADLQYSYKIFLLPKLTNQEGQADIAVEFIKYDASKPEEMEKYEKLTALIKPNVTQVANAGKLKASEVCQRVVEALKDVYEGKISFNASYHHAQACKHYKIKPLKGDPHPEKTQIDMCHYDVAHKDYVYTEKWVMFLIEELRKPNQLQKIIDSGRPVKNSAGQEQKKPS